ncbi:ABC transporter permease [Celeribacter indicus]|uniref:Binding-protein-dependent transport system inner membrane protein n=1 Tax=Celeribacter indicus TaxID=1208324 RepID=A0A0B5DS04_9RHOB|nr:ABC transporter permease [Celeribacter indicus]AJE45819.1 binding-protein-dependent transport system inner membrane protein [Celeribacter indicus]SDW61429.1 peptide/nickel transport system permease protein [Celeribacter indicus]
MLRYLLRRIVILLLSLFVAALVLFVLLRLLPGDPAAALVGVGATPEQIAAAQEQVGSDLPLGEQFLTYLHDLLRFDLGRSFVSRAPVIEEIRARLSVTLPLTFAAFVLALLLAVPLGVLAAVTSKRWSGLGLSVISQAGIAVPVFWLGIIMVYIFALNLRWLPSGGFPLRGYDDPARAIRSIILPVLTIALVMSASLMRYVRAATLEVLDSEFLRTARALGESFTGALLRHGLRNGAVPVVAVLGIELSTTFLGAVVVEQVFSLPGMGSMLLLAIQQRDYPNIQGVLLVSTLLVLITGFLADILQRLLDPRLRGGARR